MERMNMMRIIQILFSMFYWRLFSQRRQKVHLPVDRDCSYKKEIRWENSVAKIIFTRLRQKVIAYKDQLGLTRSNSDIGRNCQQHDVLAAVKGSEIIEAEEALIQLFETGHDEWSNVRRNWNGSAYYGRIIVFSSPGVREN